MVSSRSLNCLESAFCTFEASYVFTLKEDCALSFVSVGFVPFHFEISHAILHANPTNHLGVLMEGGFLPN